MASPLADVLDTKVVQLPKTEPQGANLARLKLMFSEARDLTAEPRREALIDLAYYHGAQWTAEERQALRARKQPDIVINRVKPAVNGMVGVVEQGKSEPRAYPRTPNDADSADVATDVLRFIADVNRFKQIKQDCFLDMLVPGSMAAIVSVDGDLQVEIVQVRWEEFLADPRSRRRDFKDARYLGVAKWMFADDVKAMYADKASEIEAAIDGGGLTEDQSYADRPFGVGTLSWGDRRRRRLLVVEMYYREAGSWQRCVFTGSGILEEGPSPYTDHKGRPDCPIEAHSAYVDGDNNRYGVVRDMRGPQDEINKRRSKLLHLLSVSQIEVADPSAIDVDADVARAEAARPDGVIPYGWRKVSTSDMAQGQANLLAEAKAEIERMGPNPAVLGRSGEDQSGRALLARQTAGLVELAILFGGLEDWELRIYRQCWARAKQFWTAPDWIRVTEDDDAPRFVGINQPVTPEMAAQAMQQQGQESAPGQGEPQADPMAMQAPQQPYTPVLGYQNQLAEMDVDITLDAVTDVGSARQEQFAELMRLLSSNPLWGQQVPFEVALELSDIPHKKSVKDKLKKHAEAAAQQQAEAAEIAKASALSNLKKTDSETALNEARADATHAGVLTDAIALGHHTAQPAAGDNGRPGSSAPQV